MNKNNQTNMLKKIWDKFWFLLWKDDSPKGWIFSVIFIFVFIKFIFFPGLSLVTGTSLPLAIVESCSMYHQGNLASNFDTWWERHDGKYENFDIQKEDFEKYKMKNGFNKGDILIITGVKPDEIKVGDIIIFAAGQANPIIHRVISISEENVDGERTFSTIGDNNNGQISFEKNIKESQIVGKAQFKLAPYLGWVKLIFYEHLRPENQKGFCVEN